MEMCIYSSQGFELSPRLRVQGMEQKMEATTFLKVSGRNEGVNDVFRDNVVTTTAQGCSIEKLSTKQIAPCLIRLGPTV